MFDEYAIRVFYAGMVIGRMREERRAQAEIASLRRRLLVAESRLLYTDYTTPARRR